MVTLTSLLFASVSVVLLVGSDDMTARCRNFSNAWSILGVTTFSTDS